MTPAPHGGVRAGARRVWRRWGAVIATVIFLLLLVAFVVRERAEFFRTWRTLREADPLWVTLAVALGLGIQLLLGLTASPVLRRLGYRLRPDVLVRAHLQRHVVGTVVPLGGPASMVAYVRALERAGAGADDALFTALLNSVLGYVALALVLTPAVLLAAAGGQLSGFVLLGAGALTLLLALMLGGLALLLLGRRDGQPRDLVRWLPWRLTARAGAVVAQARSHGLRARDVPAFLLPHLPVDLLGATTLYVCLRAVGHHASLREAVVGYAIGTLFLMLAPVFQGLGAVELSMTVALTGFGVPRGAALAAVLLYRAVETWLPAAVGVMAQAGERVDVDARRLAAHIPALLTGFTGGVAVLSVLDPRLSRRFNRLENYSVADPADLSRHLTLIAGFLLLFLSYSLWRRKRVAWLASCGLLAVTIVTHILKRHDEIGAILSAVTLTLLLAQRQRYRVRSDVPTLALGIARFVASLLLALAYGTLGFFLMDRRSFGVNFTFADAVNHTLRLYFSLGDAGLTPRTRYADWVLDSLSIVGVVALAYAVFSLARPVVWRRRTLPHERQRARQLIERWGDSSLDFFKWQPDKLFFFASTGRGVVAYRVALATAVALGDPVAETPEDLELTLAEFLDFCDANAWRVAFHQVPPARLAAYRAAGLQALKIGEEAVVDLTAFTLSGKAMRHLRATVNRFEREGYQSVYYPAPLDDTLLAGLREVSNEWLTIEGRRERSFTLGHFSDAYLRATPVMTVEDDDQRVVAFANLIPDGAAGEATSDLMRRRVEPSGAMDFLYVRLFEQLRADGYTRFSLGLAPFAEVGRGPDARLSERAMHLGYERFNRFFAYKGLHDYKDKFGPSWEARYLVYQSAAALPQTVLALIRVTEASELPVYEAMELVDELGAPPPSETEGKLA
jgi:phosphatidylglycerol lysyltransferase